MNDANEQKMHNDDFAAAQDFCLENFPLWFLWQLEIPKDWECIVSDHSLEDTFL